MLIKCVEWVIWTRKGTLARSLLMLMVGNWMDHTANVIFRFLPLRYQLSLDALLQKFISLFIFTL